MPFKKGQCGSPPHQFTAGNKAASKAARVKSQAKKLGLPIEAAVEISRAEMIRQARFLTNTALKALVDALKDRRYAVAAATVLLDRGWGKPQQHIVTTGSPFDSIDSATISAIVEYFGIGEVSADGQIIAPKELH